MPTDITYTYYSYRMVSFYRPNKKKLNSTLLCYGWENTKPSFTNIICPLHHYFHSIHKPARQLYAVWAVCCLISDVLCMHVWRKNMNWTHKLKFSLTKLQKKTNRRLFIICSGGSLNGINWIVFEGNSDCIQRRETTVTSLSRPIV